MRKGWRRKVRDATDEHFSQWKWLQPYLDAADQADKTRYMSLSVGQDDGKLRTDPAPYTLTEGFLQLAAPIIGRSST